MVFFFFFFSFCVEAIWILYSEITFQNETANTKCKVDFYHFIFWRRPSLRAIDKSIPRFKRLPESREKPISLFDALEWMLCVFPFHTSNTSYFIRNWRWLLLMCNTHTHTHLFAHSLFDLNIRQFVANTVQCNTNHTLFGLLHDGWFILFEHFYEYFMISWRISLSLTNFIGQCHERWLQQHLVQFYWNFVWLAKYACADLIFSIRM